SDAIAGGGGLISLPTFLMTGIPPHIALGTNKFSSSMGTLVSSANFIKSKKADMNLLKYILPFVFLGALLGVYSVLLIDANILTPFVGILILVVGVYTMFSKNMGMI
ncbi:TSUP family transporter, partial [Arthrospira platensis SPKY1]|nr:TSUP family transporter [Arthrospira platensis SPKY1]